MSPDRAILLPTALSAPPALHDLGAALALAARHPRLVAAFLATAGCVLLAGATTLVSLLGLPAMVLTAPWVLSLSLVASALFVARQARRRLGTGGIDADTERGILEVAVARGGQVTTTALAHALSMPLVVADAALMALSRAGYLGVETHPASGVLVYVFPEIDAGLVPPEAFVRSDAPEISSPETALARSGTAMGLVRVSCKSRSTAAFLAIYGGSLGVQKFYLGQPLAGLFHLVMFWTLLPAIAGIVEGLGFLLMTDHAFDLKHNARLS